MLVSAAEWVKNQTFNTNCPATYVPPGQSGYSVSASIAYLDDTGAAVACSATTNLQVVTVSVHAPSGYVTDVSVVKRNTA